MLHRSRTLQPQSHTGNDTREYTKLENRLILLAYLNRLFGYETNKELLSDTRDVAEGFDAEGRSYLYYHLIARGSKVKIPEDALKRYDDNIRNYLVAVNRGRAERITLRYFQYLAALYTEIVLDNLFNYRSEFLKRLNTFVHEQNSKKIPEEQPFEEFSEDNLTKLAFWMATGSGKTLLLHLNYYQFLHYNKENLDNILLITPNEGLSEQHLAELAVSGIPARRFDLNTGGLWSDSRDVVQVIEITKLVEEKRGGGVSVPVEAFEGRNLIFVDEGHKGSGGEAWRKYRDALSKTGFTFEYSATFGQALSAARNDPLTAEYGKAIVFDYSYRYFYGDGYGKDFRILNLRDETDDEKTDLLLLGNLLSFYEQNCLYREQREALRSYNLEKPLWVFVGSTVNAVYSQNNQKRSDVLTVARFLHRVLENKQNWAVEAVKKLLDGKSGLVTTDGSDVFAGRFPYLNEKGIKPQALYQDILNSVFHAPASGALHVFGIKNNAGELGLKAAGADKYFGLIYIGDAAEFKKLLEEDSSGITLGEDAISASLFEKINRLDSEINILIGAKKFMEGWNSWRVSNMGLLNIGRKEGSQIIQLFGRGVRLRGKDFLLKRSSALGGDHPKHIKLLETLNIFAVRANYMAQFRDYLEREGVETDEVIDLPLFVWANEQFLERGLVVPRLAEGREFINEAQFRLDFDSDVKVHVDLSTKVQALESSAPGLWESQLRSGIEGKIPADNLALVDWEQIYLDVLAYKENRGLTNLVIPKTNLRRIIENPDFNYTLVADESVFNPRTFTDRNALQQAVADILRKYVDRFYRHKREEWERMHLVYKTLDENDPNLAFNRHVNENGKPAYIVKVSRSKQEIIEAIRKLSDDLQNLIKGENGNLPRLNFDRHIYLPLLLKKNDLVITQPPALEESESRFVKDLRDYWQSESKNSPPEKEVFLLRNLSRGKGIGFFGENNFYPDFILWVLDNKGQRIIFVEPHGMIYAKPYNLDDKARLHERLPELAVDIANRTGRTDIRLDSFIISATPYPELRIKYDDGSWDLDRFTQKHILFPNRPLLDGKPYDYIRIILEG
ncbi:DEAD/DEAH box helicase family protein [Anaerolinea thermophila]|nr:DEAD/DEAH box helicase family protein [Anaerolinea thermophila]